MLSTAKEKNSLVCLGTGAGKTYIAVMLISDRSHELELPYDEGGKRTFFLVPTRPLVKQQAAEIVSKSRFTEDDVGQYTGDMNVDFWSNSVWLEHLRAKKIFVMTRQIFLNILSSGALPLHKVNLLIFDEAHHAAPKSKGNKKNKDVYNLIMEYINSMPKSEHPHILGLSASLINANTDATKLCEKIASLEQTFNSTCTSATDVNEVRKYATDPVECIHDYDNSTINFKCDIVKELLSSIAQIFSELKWYREEQSVDVNKRSEEVSTGNVGLPIGIDDFIKCESFISLILSTMGPWCSVKACDFYIKEFQNYIDLYEHSYPPFCKMLRTVNEMIETVNGLIQYHFFKNQVSLNDMILKFVSDKMKELLSVLKEYADTSESLAGIVFVKRRAICKALCKWLLKVKEVDAEFSFIKADYIVGEAVRPGFANKIAVKAAQAQKESLNKFRKRELNLLCATSILEEGLDVSQCNLVIRFDGVSSYREWVQSQGRARSKDGRFVVFTERESRQDTEKCLSEFKDLSNRLQSITTTVNRAWPPSVSSNDVAIPDDEKPIINPSSGARVTLNSAKQIVFMYCSRLPSDAFFTLSPMETLIETSDGVQFTIRLPINSPVKEVIQGPVKRNESTANGAAYLKVCRILREHDEIDESFVPYSKQTRLQKIIDEFNLSSSISDFDEDEVNDGSPKPGTRKRKQIYLKSFEKMFASMPIKSLTPNCLYYINIEPSSGDQSLGFICSKQIRLSEIVSSFPVYIKTTKYKISVTAVNTNLTLSPNQLNLVKLFHQVVFHESLGFKRSHFSFDEESSVYVVPLNHSLDVDWDMIERTLERDGKNKKSSKPTDEERIKFTFNYNDYKGAIVYRLYEPIGLFEVLDVDTKTSDSPFPSNEHGYGNYVEYYAIRYGLTVVNTTCPLLKVESIGFNSSIRRVKLTKAERKRKSIQLVPEFLLIFPLPTTFHRKCRLIPAVFYRLCQMYNVEQMRNQICISADFGWEPLPANHTWGILSFERSHGQKDKVMCNEDSYSDEQLTTVDDCNEMECSETAIQPSNKSIYGDTNELVQKYSNFNVQTYVDNMRAKLFEHYNELLRAPLFTSDHCNQSEYMPLRSAGMQKDAYVDFDRVKSFDYHISNDVIVGPSPSQLLQALTPSKAMDMFNMERLETLGDSFLKLTTSAYLYCKLPALNEGYLSLLKADQISNRNLYRLGKSKKLPEFMIGHEFQPGYSWLPPGFNADLHASEKKIKVDAPIVDFHRFTQQQISDKSVADCCEALIGAYLLTSGPIGAVNFMTWLGIRIKDPLTTQETKLTTNHHWLPPPRSALATHNSSIDAEIKIKNMSSTLTGLEENIGYTFRDKSFLIQATTHISYHDNTVTDCYQRLEFLGDAVLDYLITRYIYDDPKRFSPGDLTNLRAALTNNSFFGSLAVKHKFHVHLKMNSYELYRAIYSFATKCKINENDVVYGQFTTLMLTEREVENAEEIEVPKALGDVFESIAGAIYLDSNYSLDTVWRVYFPLMQMELGKSFFV